MNGEIGALAAMGGVRSRLLRGMYGVNVVGAGIPGLATLLAPGWVADNLFGAPQDPVSLRMLAAVWLSVGALSVLGLRRPLRFSAVFPMEAMYKSLWLATVAPTLLAGERPEVVPLAVLFATWAAADLYITPWSYLLDDAHADKARS